ncbi:MAG: glycosyltransferase family 39 protein, partial [Candidatus Hodarchaeota archaeon]
MKSHLKILLVFIIIAFIARILISYHWRDTFDKRGNALYVINIALNLINGDGYCVNEGVPSIDHEPGYPLFLAVGYKLFGYNWFGQYFFQIILSILTGILIYLIGKQLLGIWVGVIASIYFMFYPYLFTQNLSVIDTTIFIFFLALIIYLFQCAVMKKQIKFAILTG